MTEPRDLRDLVGEDIPPEELERLRQVDALLRATPPPPAEIPTSLTRSVRGLVAAAPLWTRRRALAAVGVAATLAGLAFGLGFWSGGGDSFETVREVQMQATGEGAGASGLIRLGRGDGQSGNWPLELRVEGLPQLPEGGYYILWLAKDGRFAGTCGVFNVGEGTTTVRMSASYRLRNYDDWVVTAWLPGDRQVEGRPWLLRASTV